MSKVIDASKVTDYRFLNMYNMDVEYKDGVRGTYQIASRAKTRDELKAISGKTTIPDAVAIAASYVHNGEHCLVLLRQFRYPVGDYIYELPAGLTDANETIEVTAIREMKEETGLKFIPAPSDLPFNRPFFSSPGMTDETCAIVMGSCVGIPSNEFQEQGEDAKIIFANYKECERILKEELVDMRTMALIVMFMMALEDK